MNKNRRFHCLAALLLIASPNIQAASSGLICLSCYDVAAAAKEATRFLLEKDCGKATDTTPHPVCHGRVHNLAVINPGSNSVFAFRLDAAAADATSYEVAAVSLTAAEQQGWLLTANLSRDFITTIKIASDGRAKAALPVSGSKAQPAQTNEIPASCPDDTALATLSAPAQLQQLLQAEAQHIMPLAAEKLQRYAGFAPKFSAAGSHLSYQGKNYLVNWSRQAAEPFYLIPFRRSEVKNQFEGLLEDFLMVNFRFNGFEPADLALMSYQIDLSSRIATYSLEELGGLFGPVRLKDSCVLARLRAMGQFGKFSSEDGEVSPFASHGTVPTPTETEFCRVFYLQNHAPDPSLTGMQQKLAMVFNVPAAECR